MSEKSKKKHKCMKVRCKDKNMIPYLKKKVYSTKHFENILLILINEDKEQNEGKNFSLLTNGAVMRAVLRDNEGGEDVVDKVKFMKEFYKGNELMNSLIEASKSLKVHNLVEQIKDVKKNYDGYFTKLKNGDTKAKPPKPKKLKAMNNVTVFTDGYKAFTYKNGKKKNMGKKIGINLANKMKYTHLPHKYIENVVGSMDNISNININYSNGFYYFLINYKDNSTSAKVEKVKKYAAVDPGLDNLLSIYIDDENSKSLIVDGEKYVDYNAKFNRLIGIVNAELDYYKNLKDEEKEGLKVDLEIKRIYKFRSFLYEKRNNFFYSEFHKLSVRVLEYLKSKGVTHLGIPNNLAYLKNDGNCNLRKDVKQSFIQIPFTKLLKNIKSKAYKYGITVEDVNEAYTSKTSSLSQDIIKVQEIFWGYDKLHDIIKSDDSLSANVFKGKRAKRAMKEKKGHRGDYFDYILNVFINSDLNGAKNICSLLKKNKTDNYGLFKLCNPVKLKSDGELLNFVKQ